jgi:leucyl/phenylalanyl-tRNA--protein transferase
MAIEQFPPVDQADEHGLLARGGDLDVQSLLLAYKSGIFPWPIIPEVLTWFAPPRRTVLFLDDFHASSSLLKAWKKQSYTFAIDRDFAQVIKHCAEVKNRKGQHGTWITPAMVKAYTKLHKAGFAHSIECYRDGALRGGLYGVSIGSFFAGESMFHLEPNTSKLALYFLVQYLKEKGCKWIDCQVTTALLKAFGAKELDRAKYMQLLKKVLEKPLQMF